MAINNKWIFNRLFKVGGKKGLFLQTFILQRQAVNPAYKPLLGRRISSVCSPSVSSSVYHHTFNCAYCAQKSPAISYNPYNIRHVSCRVLLRSRGSSAGSISIRNQLLHGLCQLVLCTLDQLVQNIPVQALAAEAGVLHGLKRREEHPQALPRQSPAASTGV